MAKFVSASKAISLIRDNMTIGIGGFGGFSAPDELLRQIASSYAVNNTPRGLHVVSGISPGDLDENGYGLSIISAEGIISSIYAAHVGMSPAIGRAVGANRIAGFTIPLGVYGQLLKASAAKQPGVLTRVGLHTLCDPRIDGCAVNDLARRSGRDVVSLITIDKEDYLLYKTFPIDACIIRGTYADEAGNISLQREALYSEQLAMATAVHNNGGIVIVQVAGVVKKGDLDPRHVKIHNCVVDYVVVSSPENHLQCYDGSGYRPELVGEKRVIPDSVIPIDLSFRKICGRRGAMEITAGSLINLGIGMPDSISAVASEEGFWDQVTLAIETGVFGGIPVRGVGLGAAVNPEAIYMITDNFDLYDGGGLDIAFFGAAEIDEQGNVNVSMFGNRCTGPGGFIDISQNTHKVCFMGTFTADKVFFDSSNGNLFIKKDGDHIKFRKNVEQITFSAKDAKKNKQKVLYITERAVFCLTRNGVMLTEIAPGVDLEIDILSKMEFIPHISPCLKLMDERIFSNEKMGLKLKNRKVNIEL